MKAIKSFVLKNFPASSVVRLRALDYRFSCPEEQRLLSILCDKRKASADIGANLGTLTYFLARYSSHVYAYEPNPELARRLRRAFRKNVTVIEAALSDVHGTATLNVPFYRGTELHGLASIAQAFEDAEGIKKFSVPVRTLDEEGLQNVGFLKIDVEQNEEKVLRGGMRLIKDQRPNLLLEVTPKLYRISLIDFLADFLALGYRGYFFYDHKLLRIEDYCLEVHNSSQNYGVRGKYVTNVILSRTSLQQ
jgi:FkbM family methyltransferase